MDGGNRVDSKISMLGVMANSGLEEVTQSLRDTLNQVYESENENVVIVLRCQSMTDCFHGENTIQTISDWEKVLRQLEMVRAIVVFISDGNVFGHALDLLLVSDFRAVHAVSQMGFSMQNGIARPGVSLYRLANQVGQAHARRMGLAGRTITSEEACDLGLVDEVFDDERQVLDRALGKFRDTSSSELAIRRRLILEAHALEYDNALGAYLAASARGRPRSPA